MKLKKVLALVLCAAMVLGTMSFNVFAADYVAYIDTVGYESIQDAIDNAQPGETVTIKEGTYEVPKMKAGITVVGEGEVLLEGTLSGTLEDLTLKNLHIKGGNAQRWAYAKGALVFEKVTFEATSVYALHFDGITEDATLLYKDCTIIGRAAMGGSPASCVFEGCTIKDNGTYGVIRTYFDAEIKDCTFDVAGANPDDVYQDGIHAVNATVEVNNCTNTNGDIEDIINISNEAFIYVDDVLTLVPEKTYSVDTQTAFEEALKSAGDVVIDLTSDVTLDVSNAYIELGTDKTKSITINGNGYRLDLTTTYWSRLNMANPDAKLILNNLTVDSSQEKGTWNSYDVTFLCPVELNGVTFEKAVALENDAKLTNVSITETHDYYALWVCANGSTVEIDGLTINSEGRGIKIDDEYCNENTAKVDFSIKNSDINSKKKAGIMVKTSAGAEITAENVDITDVAADSENLVWVDEDGAADYGNVTVIGATKAVEGEDSFVAAVTNGENTLAYYKNLADALRSAENGETVKLLADITYTKEDVVYAHGGVTGFGGYDKYNPSIIYVGGTKGATDDQNQPSKVNAVLDLNGHTITNNANAYLFFIMDNAKVTFTDSVGGGAIVGNNSYYPVIWVTGTDTLVTIESGTYTTASATGLFHSTHAGDLVITGGEFKTTADDASLLILLNSKLYNNPNYFISGVATVKISGGTFHGFNPEKVGDDNGATSIEDIKFVNGCAEGFDAIIDTYGMYKVVEAADTDEKIAVKFEEVETVEGEKLYNINLVADAVDAAAVINRLNSADLTFKFTGTPVNGGAMDYEILEVANISVTTNSDFADRYMFSFDTKTGVTDTANTITIGQVKITGYGTFDFEIVGDKNEVHATTINDNVVDTFIPNGAASGKGDLDITAKLDDVENKVPTRKLTIQIAFPNTLEKDNEIAYQDMKVTIKGNIEGVEKEVVYDLGSDGYAMKNGGYVVTEDKLVLNNAYTVTVSGAGYRTARYTVTMTDDKTLNFWNNVKGNDTIVEVGKASSAVKVTFLAGDIVKDNNINIYDLSAVVSYFGTEGLSATNKPEYAKYDLNRDGVIDSKDVAYVLVSWDK